MRADQALMISGPPGAFWLSRANIIIPSGVILITCHAVFCILSVAIKESKVDSFAMPRHRAVSHRISARIAGRAKIGDPLTQILIRC